MGLRFMTPRPSILALPTQPVRCPMKFLSLDLEKQLFQLTLMELRDGQKRFLSWAASLKKH